MLVFRPTCFSAALASTVSMDSTAVAPRPVGVAEEGVAAGERRGVDVRENSSGMAPTVQSVHKNKFEFIFQKKH